MRFTRLIAPEAWIRHHRVQGGLSARKRLNGESGVVEPSRIRFVAVTLYSSVWRLSPSDSIPV